MGALCSMALRDIKPGGGRTKPFHGLLEAPVHAVSYLI